MRTQSFPHPYDAATVCMNVERDITPFFTGSGPLTRIVGADGKLVSRRWGLVWSVPMYTFTNGRPPLTFHDYDGTAYQPDNHFDTDSGSTPPPLWGFPFLRLDPVTFSRAYPMHDSHFKYGGLYVRVRGEMKFKFRLIPRAKGNELLKRMVIADGAKGVEAVAVYSGVAAFSRFCWDEKEQARNRAKDNIKVHVD